MAVLEEPIKEPLALRNFIGGEWVASKGEVKDVVNPATGKVIARVPISTKAEFDQAVEAAKEAYPDWRSTPPGGAGAVSLPLAGTLGGAL